MIIIVDSDGFIGNLNPEDQHFSDSQKISSKLTKIGAELIYPATVIVETVTFLQGRLNRSDLAQRVIQLIADHQFNIEPVDDRVIQEASLLMDFNKSKHDTLFDAIVAAVAQKYKADAIFSFDHFYKNKGFKLASEI